MADRNSASNSSSEASRADADGATPGGTKPSGGGGFKAWLPLLLTIVTMPALAYATTRFIIAPQLAQAVGRPAGGGGTGEAGPAAHGAERGAKGGPKEKQSVSLNKMIVNVSGTMGTRYLLTSLSLVGVAADFKTKIEEHRDQLLDLAAGALSNKTIPELEKPGARNQIRTELLSVFSGVLGENTVQEIFITEFAIQ